MHSSAWQPNLLPKLNKMLYFFSRGNQDLTFSAVNQWRTKLLPIGRSVAQLRRCSVYKCSGTTCSTTWTAGSHITRNSWAPLVTDPCTRVLYKLRAYILITAADHRHTLKTLSQHAVQPHSDLVCVQLRPLTTSSHDFLPSSENVLSPTPVHVHGTIFLMNWDLPPTRQLLKNTWRLAF